MADTTRTRRKGAAALPVTPAVTDETAQPDSSIVTDAPVEIPVEPPASTGRLPGLAATLGFGRRGSIVRLPPRILVSVLATDTGTPAVILGAIKTAYGWTDETRLTREDFIRLRDTWLTQPAREVTR